MKTLLCLLSLAAFALPTSDLTAAIDVRFDPGDPHFIVRPGAESAPAFVLSHPGPGRESTTLHYLVESFDGSLVTRSEEVRLCCDAPQRITLAPEVFATTGIKWVEYWLSAADAEPTRLKTSFSYHLPSREHRRGGKPGSFLFSLAYGPYGDARRPDAAESAAMLGVRVIRNPVSWDVIQPRADAPIDWSGVDTVIEQHAAHGIEVIMMVHGCPEWARLEGATGRGNTVPPDPGAWRTYMRTFATRYAGRVRFWENWNEPDLHYYSGNAAQYLEMQRIFFEEIKAVNPQARVMTGGFGDIDHPASKPGFIETILRDGRQWFDVIAYHRHGYFPEFSRALDGSFRDLLRETGNASTPLYFTETSLHDVLGQRNQAETLVKKFAFTWSRGAVGHVWFNWRDPRPRSGNPPPAFRYGLHLFEGNPKAALPAYNTLTSVLGRAEHVRQIDPNTRTWAHLFRSSDEPGYVVLSWQEDALGAPPHLALRTDASAIERIDIMGNSTAIALSDGVALLPVDPTPAYHVLHGARSEPEWIGYAASASRLNRLLPGSPSEVQVELFNPFTRAREAELSWEMPAGLEARSPTTATIRLQPGERRSVSVAVQGADSAAFGDLATVHLAYRFKGDTTPRVLSVPVEHAGLALRGDAQVQVTLNKPHHYTFPYDHDPAWTNEAWGGPKDLSATVRLARGTDALHLQVSVTDDRFAPPDGTDDLTGGDGISLFLTKGPGAGLWEFHFASVAGVPRVQARRDGQSVPLELSTLSIEPADAGRATLYQFSLPDAVTGLTAGDWTRGVRANVLVGDRDGRRVRSGWLSLAPWNRDGGDPTLFPVLIAR